MQYWLEPAAPLVRWQALLTDMFLGHVYASVRLPASHVGPKHLAPARGSVHVGPLGFATGLWHAAEGHCRHAQAGSVGAGMRMEQCRICLIRRTSATGPSKPSMTGQAACES